MAKSFTIPSYFTAYDSMTKPLRAMAKSVKGFFNQTEEEAARAERRYRSLGNTAESVARKAALIGFALLGPLILAAREAVQFEDKMADIAKTTGLSGKALEDYGQGLLDMSGDTRTSIEDLQAIGEIGGQLGIAQKDLLSFTDAANKFNVALGKDFSGGVEEATSAVGTIATLFKDTKTLSPADALMRIGSSINELGATGSSTSANIVDFSKRLGALPGALKPAATDANALGAYFEEMGISSEIAARGFGDVLLTAGTNLNKFAKQMGVSKEEAAQLLNTDPSQFAKNFAQSFKGMSNVDLAKKLKSLKIGDAGTIKVIGALGENVDRLTVLQELSNRAFQEGTSLQSEYDKKNNTAAANMAKAMNNLKAFAITAGTLLLPVLNDLIKMMVPVLRAFTGWIRNNPKLTKTIMVLVGVIGVFSLGVSAVAVVVKLYADIMLVWAARTKIMTAVQWALTAAMNAMPIFLIITAIIALIFVVTQMVKHWNEWGAALSLVMGPLGVIISMVMSFRRNWDMISKAFSEGSFLDGIIAIGKTINDAILMPMQQLLEIIASVTGAKWAGDLAKNIEAARTSMGVEVTPAVNPKKEEQDALISRQESVQSQNIGINIKDETGRASVDPGNGLITPKFSSTMAFQ